MNLAAELPPADALALLRDTPMSRLIAESIEDMVVRGVLQPGERLNEVELARRFGVSRGPLREAIRLLEVGGLFRQERNRGTFVRKIPLVEAAHIYEVRAGLDATAGRILCAGIGDDRLALLRDLTNRMQAVKEDDVAQFHGLNLHFHDQLIALTANPVLIDTYRKLAKQLALFRRRNLYAPSAIQNLCTCKRRQAAHVAGRRNGRCDRCALSPTTPKATSTKAQRARSGFSRALHLPHRP
jgi:DNA-binding GntR family transcriptional regulator